MPQDGRQADRLGERGLPHSVFIVLGPPYASWCTGPWVVPDCRMRPGEQAADLIFQHTAAPTSGPGEGDLPCLLVCLLKRRGAVDAVPNPKNALTSGDVTFCCRAEFRSVFQVRLY